MPRRRNVGFIYCTNTKIFVSDIILKNNNYDDDDDDNNNNK